MSPSNYYTSLDSHSFLPLLIRLKIIMQEERHPLQSIPLGSRDQLGFVETYGVCRLPHTYKIRFGVTPFSTVRIPGEFPNSPPSTRV